MSPSSVPQDTIAYKVLTTPQMAELLARGQFAGAPVDVADGFIHLSTAAQLPGTLAKHFAGQKGLHIAAVDLAALGDAVRWEVSRGGDLFPHIYGPLPLSALVAHGALAWAAPGVPALPQRPVI